MHKMITEYVKTCEICKMEKYDRKPQECIPVKTPIPNYPGEIVHIDIFVYNAKNLFIISLDKFSKFLKIRATFLEDHEIWISSFEELLSTSTAQVMLNETHIIYVLKILQLSRNMYDYEYIDSIIKDNKRIVLTQNYMLRNHTHVLELTNSCEEYKIKYACESIFLKEPSECVQKLVRREHANCPYEKV